VNLTTLNSDAEERCPGMEGDGLTLYFGSNRAGGLGGMDVYVATRPTRSSAWSQPQPVAELNSSVSEWAPHPAAGADPLAMVLSRTSGDGTSRLLYLTRRSSSIAPWGTPVAIDELNTVPYVSPGWLDASETLLLFTSSDSVVGVKNRRVMVALRPSPQVPFGPAVALLGVKPNEDPWLSSDLRTLYFSSNGDIYMATR
jgi:hypothetical protein